ncbi:MAG: sensor histidine kinase [Lysobacterales bacterium]
MSDRSTPRVFQRETIRAWARALGVSLLWFGMMALAIGGMYQASIPDLPAITEIEAAASHEPAPGADLPPVDAEWMRYTLPLRICKVRCDTLYTVYRHRFDVDSSAPGDLAVYLPFFDANLAVYLNGAKLDQQGSMLAPVDVYRYHSRLVRLPRARLQAGPNELILQLVAERRHLGGLSPFYLGPVESLSGPQLWRQRLTESTVAGVGWLHAGSFLVALILFLIGRRESLLGWYLLSAVFWLGLILLHASPTMFPGSPWRWTALFTCVAGVLSFSPLFIVGILQSPPKWLVRTLTGYFAASLALILYSTQFSSLDAYWQFQLPNYTLKLGSYILVPLMLGLVLRIVLQRKNSWSAAWMLALAAMPGILGIADAVLGTLAPPLEFALLPLGGLGISLALWLELAARVVENNQRMASHAAELEQTLRAREADLHESYERLRMADRERALSEERQRLLRDMHDGVGGQLASLVHLAGNPETGREQVVAGLREGLADLRLVLDSLAQQEDDPLVALGRLRHRIQPTLEAAGIKLHWAVDPDLDLPTWSPEAVLNIYRLLQEAIHNVIRHAQAGHLTIGLRAAGAQIEFSVVDDGVGLDLAAAQGRGFGLGSLRARTARMGGEIEFRRGMNAGTAVIVRLPRQPAPASLIAV